MKIEMNSQEIARAKRNLDEIYKTAFERACMSAIGNDRIQLMNAFQVFRYAFREWALRNERGDVLRALMLADSRAKEVRCNSREMVIQVEDDGVAEALARLLEGDGYTEESN